MDIPEIEKVYIPSRCIHCMKVIDDDSYNVFGHGGLQQPQKVCYDCYNKHWKECNNCHKHIPVDCTVCPCCEGETNEK